MRKNRMYDDLFTVEDDNPTIGLILCAEPNESIAKYSVLKDNKKLLKPTFCLCTFLIFNDNNAYQLSVISFSGKSFGGG